MNETNATLVAEFEKNARERVRVSLTEYGGHRLLDLRAYYQDATGEWRPGKGLTLRRDCRRPYWPPRESRRPRASLKRNVTHYCPSEGPGHADAEAI